MIVRVWSGATAASRSQEYLTYLETTGVRECLSTAGTRGVRVLTRREGELTRFMFESTWDSAEAIRGFAGEDPERAVFYPRDAEFLVEAEDRVLHYELAIEANPPTAV